MAHYTEKEIEIGENTYMVEYNYYPGESRSINCRSESPPDDLELEISSFKLWSPMARGWHEVDECLILPNDIETIQQACIDDFNDTQNEYDYYKKQSEG